MNEIAKSYVLCTYIQFMIVVACLNTGHEGIEIERKEEEKIVNKQIHLKFKRQAIR